MKGRTMSAVVFWIGLQKESIPSYNSFGRFEYTHSLSSKDMIFGFTVSQGKELEGVTLVFVLGFLLVAIPMILGAAEKEITIGTVEDVVLLPWGVKLPARIDTGAARSALDAEDLVVQGNMAEFKLPKKYGGTTMKLPIVEWRHVRTTQGLKRRPVVEIGLCLGPKRLRTQVALDNRKGLRYPLLLGRNTLKGNFVVDVKRKNVLIPACQTPQPL